MLEGLAGAQKLRSTCLPRHQSGVIGSAAAFKA